MKNAEYLERLLSSLDGQKYGAYKKLRNTYQFNQYRLAVDHVQVDPYAPPSKMRIIIKRTTSGIPDELLDSKDKITAVSDFLTRAFYSNIKTFNKNSKGKNIFIDRCGQEILERTSVMINRDTIELRFEVGLPAAGRKIRGKSASQLLTQMLPKIVRESLFYSRLDQGLLKEHVSLVLDQVHIRKELKQRKLTAFVANDAILPRESGVSDRPLKSAVRFISPVNFEVHLTLPSGRTVSGMGIPEGITLIVGGGYHGKSTLLQALERGVYNHIPGDGREMVLTQDDAVKIRAEDGRNIEKVNISPFINNLPGKKDTHRFSTENASGSTSQSANVIEAIEAGSSLLLIDEDTSATNFMIRDIRMQKLISSDKEPITPFTHKVKALYEELNTSTILIVGGSGDYFEAADQIFMMDEYRLKDVTDAAKSITQTEGFQRDIISDLSFGPQSSRIPLKSSFSKTGKDSRFKTKGMHTILYGREAIDLSGLEQLVDSSQTSSISAMIDYLQREVLDNTMTLQEAVHQVYRHIEENGLDAVSPYSGHPGNLALPRKQELFAALNRYRGLKIK
ncbi:ABC-ATPase domain-containing protein [Corticicoccus populi]|uniref:ABC-ATPase domain-containing protein n=1 Tax=Corticicoccus populi TaxID=1812821 RepID=A0ABW5WUW5_9STAP